LGIKDRISFWVKALWIKNIHIFVASKGGLAQLARAFDWQSKGHRFDSDILHLKIKELQAILQLFFCA
jgi:hypothetical protein